MLFPAQVVGGKSLHGRAVDAGLGVGKVDLVLRQIVLQRRLQQRQPDLLPLERLLSKRRILEIYLNHVEWGIGVFGAEAAAQHYFKKSAAQLSAWEAARLAVMLPRPRYFEQRPRSAYLNQRAATIVARMKRAELP